MGLRDRIANAISPVRATAAKVPVTLDRPLPTSLGNFTQNLTGLGRAPIHRVHPYLSDVGPKPFPKVSLPGLLVPPHIKRGYPTGITGKRSSMRKGV